MSTTSIRVSRAEAADFLGIARLDRASWQDTPNGEKIPDGEHVWRYWCEDALVFVAKKGDRVVGAIAGLVGISDKVFLHKLFVMDKLRDQGIGRLLMNRLLEELDRRAAVCYLTVHPANDSAIKLYSDMGFQKQKLVNGYYRSDEHRFVLLRQPEAKA